MSGAALSHQLVTTSWSLRSTLMVKRLHKSRRQLQLQALRHRAQHKVGEKVFFKEGFKDHGGSVQENIRKRQRGG